MNQTKKTNADLDYGEIETKYAFVKKYRQQLLVALDSLMEIVTLLPMCKYEYPDRSKDFSVFDPAYNLAADVIWAMEKNGFDVAIPDFLVGIIPVDDE